MKILLILIISIRLAVAQEKDPGEYLANMRDVYYVITLPKVEDKTNCFPQSYVPVSHNGDVLLINDVVDKTNRKPWESENMIGFTFNGKSGYCDSNGKIIIAPQFDSLFISLRPFSDHLAPVMIDEKYFYINTKGQKIAGPFDWAYDFSGGVGAVKENNLCGFVNNSGEWVVRPIFSRLDPCVAGYSAEMPSGESGFVNSNGQFIKDGDLGTYYHEKK